jgi:hypothetical protein
MKAINAALTLLGDDTIDAGSSARKKPKGEDHPDDHHGNIGELSSKGRAWMRKYKVTGEQLSEVFDFDGETVDVIADDVPGDNSKVKTINAYVVTGMGEYLKTGEVTFKDDAARAVCKHIGCLNSTNHSPLFGCA